MAQVGLSNPILEVDNEIIAFVPNTLVYKAGKGEKVVKPQSAGGNSIEIVITENAESKKSMVKFALEPTASNIELAEKLQDNIEGFSVRVSQLNFNKSFRNMVVINDPEFNLTADGNIELEMEGTPTV